jgi:hypothetical protein
VSSMASQLSKQRKNRANQEALCPFALVPLVLTHVSLGQHTVLKSTNEVPVALVRITHSASAAPLTGVRIDISVRRWWIVGRAGLQPDGCIGVQVASNSLDRRRDSSVRVHSRCSLTSRSCSRLCVEALRGHLVVWHHTHLVSITRRLLSRVGGRWCALLIHAVVHGRSLWLRLRRSVELIHLRGIRILRMRRLRCSLFAGRLGLLLLLNTRSGLVGRRILEVHWRHEWPSEFLLGDERVQFRLLWRPPLQRVDRQESAHEVDECDSIV